MPSRVYEIALLVWIVAGVAVYLVWDIVEGWVMRKVAHKKSAAHNTCWGNFSRYIRLRDAIATTGTMTHARCITCGAVLPVEEMDAGHMIPGRTNGILFDEAIVFAQCTDCNREGGGERQMFKQIMVKKHGEAWYDMKMQARKTPTKLPDDILRIMNTEYLNKIKKLKAQYLELDRDID